jgi:hypothetical protein
VATRRIKLINVGVSRYNYLNPPGDVTAEEFSCCFHMVSDESPTTHNRSFADATVLLPANTADPEGGDGHTLC